MTIKLEVAYGIIEAITDLRKGDDLEDFIVIVDGISVRCHRFILGACSLFFRALFRSGMKEDEESCATLETVSHSTFTLILTALYTGCDIITEENVIDVWRATHMLEIGFLVKECETFVEQNISIDNFGKIYETAKLLDSETVLRTEHKFMTQNFDLVRKSQSQTLLKLSFSEISALVETDELVTSSEDNVLESILQWVSYVSPKTPKQETDGEVTHDMKVLAVQIGGNDSRSSAPTAEHNEEKTLNITHDNEDSATKKLDTENDSSHKTSNDGKSGNESSLQDTNNDNCLQDKMTATNEVTIQTSAPVHKNTQTAIISGAEERQKHLLSLISKCRSCLLSPKYLGKLMFNPIIIDTPKVRSIILRAVSYQLDVGYRHGQWPSAAIHRSNSQVKHVILWAECGNYSQNICHRDSVMCANDFLCQTNDHLLATKAASGKITAFDNELYELNNDGLYILRDNTWKKIVSCQLSDKTFMTPLDNLIYFLDGSTQELSSVNPKANAPIWQKCSKFPAEFTIAGAARYEDRIIVFSLNKEDTMETVVHTFDPSNETWARLENMKGPAENIISFHNEEDTFLLQINGNLWKVTNDRNCPVKIAFSKKAWDFNWKLYGAAVFRTQLIIYGDTLPEGKHLSFFVPGSNVESRAWTVGWKICTATVTLPSKYLEKPK